MSHTRGPWVWWTSNSWKRLKRDDHGILQTVLEPYVCNDLHPDLMVSEGDMGLIAAAPDLLEALEELVRLEPITDDGEDSLERAREKAKAAIAKARGTSGGRGEGR